MIKVLTFRNRQDLENNKGKTLFFASERKRNVFIDHFRSIYPACILYTEGKIILGVEWYANNDYMRGKIEHAQIRFLEKEEINDHDHRDKNKC